MMDTVTVAFNDSYTAFVDDSLTVQVYSSNDSIIYEIMENSNITKYISAPIGLLKSRGYICNNCTHINTYINNLRDVSELNHDIMNCDTILFLSDRAANVALLMMKYKIYVDNKKKEFYFNVRRDCYLLYLTAYNDIISRFGSMTFLELTNKVRSYPMLCRACLHPALALEGLIKLKALISDSETSMISIPV